MIGLPPGTILQLLYIKKRLSSFPKGSKFLEIGSGNGMISTELLSMGFEGTAVDLNESACRNNEVANQKYIAAGKYKVVHADFLLLPDEQFDFIISCMVIEHLPDELLKKFVAKCKSHLKPGGRIIYLVPGSMQFWGIEDEIAGHIKRYEFEDVDQLAQDNGLKVEHRAGLTYPISNVLFGLSNRIIDKKESDKKNLSQLERTVYTGNREVLYKTTFPKVFNVVLNPIVLWPLHILQLANTGNRNCMILYFELTKN